MIFLFHLTRGSPIVQSFERTGAWQRDLACPASPPRPASVLWFKRTASLPGDVDRDLAPLGPPRSGNIAAEHLRRRAAMKRLATMIVGSIALVAFAGSASAALRSPQVVVNNGTLQGYLNSVGESINVGTDQLDIQRWQATVSNNSTFTIQVELAGNAASNTYGIYNASFAVPPLYQCFPGAATNGWFCVASFRTAPTRVVVSLFDGSAAFQGSTTYLAGPPDRNDFG